MRTYIQCNIILLFIWWLDDMTFLKSFNPNLSWKQYKSRAWECGIFFNSFLYFRSSYFLLMTDEKYVVEVCLWETNVSNNPLEKGYSLDRLRKPWWHMHGLETESKYSFGKHTVCTQIMQSGLGYGQWSDYRWLQLLRFMEQKQGPPFACLLFPCTQVELIVLRWKHKDRVECRVKDGLIKYKRRGLMERVGHVPFHPTGKLGMHWNFWFLAKREKWKISQRSALSFTFAVAVNIERCDSAQ